METNQVLIGHEDKKWDRPWTTDEIRKNSANWTLAGDVGLYNLLHEFSQHIISRTHEVENAVDSLVYKTKMATAKVNNLLNDFHMLSNLQFVENRVYDEEIQEATIETKPVEKTKEQKEAEMLPKIIKAVELGLQVLDQAFTRINVNEISDSEDEDLSSEGRTILEPKDPYANRTLPFIIGSEEFHNSDYAGLQDLLEEDVELSEDIESSVSETEESSSEEEEPLPLDEDKFNVKPPQPRQTQIDSDKFSSSEESELFGSEKDDNDFVSNSSFDSKLKEDQNIQKPVVQAKPDRKDSRQGSVSTIKSKLNLPQVLPVPKMPELKKENDDLFAQDEPSDDESPFRKKTGLFSSDLRFDDEADMFDNDLFGDKPKEAKKTEIAKPEPTKKSPVAATISQKKKEEPVLFGNDYDSEEDIFNTLIKTKTPAKENINQMSRQSSSDMADSSSTPSSTPSVKPSDSGFGFSGNAGNPDPLFGDESDGDDLFSSRKNSQKKIVFDATPDDDLFSIVSDPKKSISEPSPSLFEDSLVVDKPYKKIGTPLPGLVSTKDGTSESKKSEKSFKKFGQPLPGLVTKKADESSLFDDNDSSGQEDKPRIIPVQPAPVTKKTTISLFDDDADDDIFSGAPKKLMSPGESPSLTNKSTTEKIKAPSSADKREHEPSLFDNDEDDFKIGAKDKPALFSNQSKSKGLSLFEDSDSDVFSSTSEKKGTKVQLPAKKQEKIKGDSFDISSSDADDLFDTKPKSKPVKVDPVVKVADQTDSALSSKPESHPSPTKAESPEASSVSFDAPVDISKTLHVLSKDRARVSVKRRKPTKKGRQAALDSSDKEHSTISSPTTLSSTSSAPDEDLFANVRPDRSSSVESPVATHKTQEKKKMDLMSQLMSEAATTKIGKRSIVQKDDEGDDEVDIFAEASSKDRSKSRGFSFLDPIESATKVPQKQDEKETANISSSEDADNDEFFAEPSFKNFRSSISHKNSILDMDDDDDDDDDLFSTVKSNPLPKPKLETSDSDIFAEDTDIFAEAQKEKYELFPSQVYDDEDDDIFSGMSQSTGDKGSSHASKTTSSVPGKVESEKKPVFDDPLTGLLGDD